MMTCLTEGQLNDYAAGRLSTQERWELGRHLEACADCRQQVAELRDGARWLDLLGEVDATPQHVKPEVLAALAEGYLDDAPRAQVLAHVGECPECATVLGALRRGVAAAAAEPRVAAAAAVSATPPVTRQRRRLAPWASFAAAAAAVVVVGAVLLTQLGEHDNRSPVPAAGSVVRATVGERPDEAPTPPLGDALAQATPGAPAVTASAMQPPSTTARGSRAAPAATATTGRARRANSMDGRALAYVPKSTATEAMGLADALETRSGVPPSPLGSEPVDLQTAEYSGVGMPGLAAPSGAAGPAGSTVKPEARGPAMSERSITAPVMGSMGMGGGAPNSTTHPGMPGMPGRGGAGMPPVAPAAPGGLGMPPTGAGRPPEGMAAKGAFANNQLMRMPLGNQSQARLRGPGARNTRPTGVGAAADVSTLSQQATVPPQPLRNQKDQVKPPQP